MQSEDFGDESHLSKRKLFDDNHVTDNINAFVSSNELKLK